MPRPYRTTLTPEERTERARKAGRASQAAMTPEQRRVSVRRAQLAGHVAAIVDRAPELTPEQTAKLAAIFAPSGAAA